jgi:hypothetical protein
MILVSWSLGHELGQLDSKEQKQQGTKQHHVKTTVDD